MFRFQGQIYLHKYFLQIQHILFEMSIKTEFLKDIRKLLFDIIEVSIAPRLQFTGAIFHKLDS